MKLSLAQIRQIQEYLEQGISIRKIATLCQVGRNTVRRYQRNSHRSRILSEGHCFLNNNIDIIRKIFFECKINCVVLKRILKGKYNEIIQLRMLQSFCRPFREEERLSRHEKTGRFETVPGEQMQIDFGETDIVIGEESVRIKVFVSKMSYSRRIFAKAYFSEKLDSWLDGIESSFIFFGGLPRTVVSDNPKSLIKDHYAAREDRFTDKYEFFCNYYAVIPICTAVRKPNSKGKVESAVKYVKNNALNCVKFNNIIEVNQYLERWRLEISDIRKLTDPMITGPKIPKKRWDFEHSQMRKISRPPIAQLRHEERIVDINGLLRVDNVYYRVPDELTRKSVEVIAGKEFITVVYGGKTIINLDKAKDQLTHTLQERSNTPNSPKVFEKRLNELRQDKNWQQMQKTEIQRSPADYNENFGLKKVEPCLR